MKKILHKTIRWIYQIIIGLMLLFVALLSGLYFISANFEKYRSDFEKFATQVISQPVTVEAISVGVSGLEPVLELQNVEIFNDAKTKKILEAKGLHIGIDLIGSLFAWQVKPGFILVSGSKVAVYQDKNGGFKVPGVSERLDNSNNKDSVLNELRGWLFEQSSIVLEDIDLEYYLPSREIIKLNKLKLKLTNGVLRHNLRIAGQLEQHKSAAKFFGDINFRNDFLKNNSSVVSGKITLKDFSWKFPENNSHNSNLLLPFSGDIKLAVEDSEFTLKMFRQPMPIDKFSGRIVWRPKQDGLSLNITNLKFSDPWLSFSGYSKLFFANNGQESTSDTKLTFRLCNLNKAKLYYPAIYMPKNGVTWLDQAFTNSKLISGDVVLKGPLAKFPFDNGEGKFLVDTKIRKVDLHYDAEWPLVEKITGKMVFFGRNMTITSSDAKIMGEPIKFVKTAIPDLDLPILYISGEIDASSQMGLNFVNASPLKSKVGRKLQDIKLFGPMQLDLKMKMPLSDELNDQNTNLEGNIVLHDNRLSSKSWDIRADKIAGNLHFINDDLSAENIQGILFNKPIRMDITTIDSSDKDTITRVNISGSAELKDFADYADRLSSYISGGVNYSAVIDLHSAVTPNVLKVKSDLVGLDIKLPEPFNKNKDSKSKFNSVFKFGGNKLPQLSINYNDQVSAALMFRKNNDGISELVAGELRFDSKPAKVRSSSGLLITGSFDEVVWSKWREYLVVLQSGFSKGASIVRQINLKLGKLHIFDQVFTKILLKIVPQKNNWQISIAMPNLKGVVDIPIDEGKKVVGTFSKLHIVSDDKKKIDLTAIDPEKIPPLKLTINNFRYGKYNFNQAILNSEPKSGGIKIHSFGLVSPDFEVDGDGVWLKSKSGQRTIFRGTIASDNVGKIFKKWEFTDAMMNGKGGANFVLKWPNAPWQPSLTTVTGSVFVYISNGRIVNLDKSTENKLGFGRIMGLLSLQSVPRRILLDFSDVTKQGFSFDAMEGNVKLEADRIKLEKINIDGPVANIRARGTIGLKTQNYDIILNAVPRITSSIPIIATIAGGPPAGVISYFAEKIIASVIKKTVSYKYHITGSWSNPRFEVDKGV